MALVAEHARMLNDIDQFGQEQTDRYRNIKWQIRRPDGKYLCGYVWLSGATPKILDKLEEHTHYGWTFHNDVEGKYGFDCAHGGDYRNGFMQQPTDIYRDSEYVLGHIHKIIDAYL